MDDAEMTLSAFQILATATGKDRLPVDHLKDGTTSEW